LVVGEVGDYALVSRLLAERQVDTVMHFAAHTIVPESVALPLKYYGNNTCSTRTLLQACLETGVQHFVFSSTAAGYAGSHFVDQSGVRSHGGEARPRLAVRHRLSDAGRHRRAGLSARRGPRLGAPAGPRLSACRGTIGDPQ